MAANQPPRRPSWRDKVEGKATATPKGGRAWQSHKPKTASVKAGWSRRTRLLMAATVFVGLTGALIWVATLLRPPRPACLVLLGASYDDNLALPHNLQGWQSLEDFSQVTKRPESNSWLSWLGSGAIHLQHINNQMADDATWKKGWDDFTEHAVIIFVSLHGGADGKGPFLFLDDRTGSKKLYLEEVLEHLGSGKLRDKNKLLILDTTQVQAKWQRGQLHNDFVRQLKELYSRGAGDKAGGSLFVLCASDVGQRSWVSDTWQQTVFSHFIVEGLKGAADKNGDARVTVSELSHYVHDQVKQWVHDNRDAVQEPLLLGDEKSAEAVELVKTEKPYEEPSREENQVRTVDLSGLEATWKHCEELRSGVPSPAVYTPQLWRQYLDTLLRYEQIVRAGDPTGKATSLKEGLAVLEAEIIKARRLPLVSTGNALPLAAPYGQMPYWPESELRELRADDLWKGKDQKGELWKKVKDWANGRPEGEKRLLRVHLMGQMLAELSERPVAKADLKRAHDALALLGDDGRLRPVEAHYLAMLYRDLPLPEPTPEIVRLALQTRLLAERAALGMVMAGDPGFQPLIGRQGAGDLQVRRYPYSEAIFPWIQKQVDAGDQERWQGENLLFASGTDYWKQASAHFTSAKALYEKALADASLLQAALHIRDTVFANLPYYTEWLVSQQVNGETDARRSEALLKTVEQLWQEAHALAGNLEKPNPNGQAVAFLQDKRSLAERTAEMVKLYQEFQDDFDRQCQELDRDARLQRAWQKTEEALLVPFIPAAQRLHFLLNSRDFSTRLSLAQTKKEAGLAPVTDPAKESLEAGRRQGRAAVAMLGLGEPWLTEIEQTKLLDLITKPGSAQAAVSLTEAGGRIEDNYKRLREETIKQQLDGNSNPDLAKAAPQVALAHRYSQLLDGAAVALIKNDPYGPGDAHHRLDLHHLLLWQINRTVDDHWFAESTAPEAQPYYLAAAKSYSQDARDLAKVQDDKIDKQRLVALEKLESERCKRIGLTVRLQGKSPLFMTSDRQTIYWESKADAGLPPGEPVFWLDLQGQVKTSSEGMGPGRKPKGNGREGILSFPLESPLRQDQIEASASRRPLEGVAALRGRFRGQILDNSTDVRIQLIPDTVVNRYPESNAAGFAVRASEDVQQGILSVLMDASGSMGADVKTWTKDTPCKYHDATKALRGVLRKLPRGARVNVWVLGGGYDHDRRQTPVSRLNEQPILWNPENPRQLENLIDRLEETKPDGRSPIADAMVKALKSDLISGVGIKTLLVLTDGEDNESEEKGNIPDFLQREFGGKSVFLHMVFFGVDPKERKSAENQFGKIDVLLPGRGRARFVEDAADLAVRLEEALIPKVRLLQNGKSVPSAPPQGYRVSFDEDKDLRWSGELKPSNYEALVYNTFKQDIGLTPGDRLLVLLRRKGNQIAYERAVFAREESNRRRPRREKDDWLAGVLQNGHFATDGSLRLLLTLEDLANRQPQDGDFLKQSKPGFRWIQVKPRGSQDQSGLRWGNDERYPAPAWKINMMDWPVKDGNAPAPAELEVWWSRDPLPPRHAVLDHVENRARENVRVEDQSVIVESFFVPERIVSVTPDSRAKKSCLILRVTHDPRKPVFVRLVGHSAGEEHDYFREAGQYTAIFWGVDETKAKKFTAEFTSLEKFKAEAHHVLFDDLPPPTPGDRGPDNVPLDKTP